jgi:hypothetical protein
MDAGAEVEDESGSSLLWRSAWGTIRSVIETSVGILEGRPSYFDNCESDLAAFRDDWFAHPSGTRLPFKGQPGPVPIEQKLRVCMHITACTFGTAAYQRKPWQSRIASGEVSQELADRFGASTQSADAAAARMALHARFWSIAYHWVGLLNGDVLYNNQPTRYTWHGNGSNRSAIGVSAEAVLPALEKDRRSKHTAVDATFIETNRHALRCAVTHSRDQGAPITSITAHRCYSNQRFGDPGEAVWREIVKPLAAELGLDVDYSLRDRTGRPIPVEWDDDATHGFDGQLIH